METLSMDALDQNTQRQEKKTFLKVFGSLRVPKLQIRRNVLRKFTEPIMEPPCWWSSQPVSNFCSTNVADGQLCKHLDLTLGIQATDYLNSWKGCK